MTPKKSSKGFLIYLIIAVTIMLSLVYLIGNGTKNQDDPDYGTIMGYFDRLEVEKFDIDLGSGKLTLNVKGQKEEIEYKVPNVGTFYNQLFNDNYNYRKAYNEANPNKPLVYEEQPIQDRSFLMNIITTIIFLGVMIFFFVYMM